MFVVQLFKCVPWRTKKDVYLTAKMTENSSDSSVIARGFLICSLHKSLMLDFNFLVSKFTGTQPDFQNRYTFLRRK